MKQFVDLSVMKVSEGGIGQVQAIRFLKEKGIKAERGYSPYVGQSGVRVFGGKRVQERAKRLLWG